MHIALLQLGVIPLETGLPSPAALLFNHPVQGIMPLINSKSDDEHYEALATKQRRNNKNYDTVRSHDSFSIGSTVAVQGKDDGPWTHETVVRRDDHNHNNRSYMIRMCKTG